MEPAFCYSPGSNLSLNNIVMIEGNEGDPLEGIQIVIGQNYNSSTDTLIYTPVTGINSHFDSQNGVLNLSGQATVKDYRLALENVFFNTKATDGVFKRIDLSLSNLDFLPSNGHFYQFFAQSGISWTDARDLASQKEFFGLKGYLATITTTEENDFILNRVSGTAWIGASDAQQEGTWRWVTGPEAQENGGQGRLINSGFTNWNSNEPNNQGDEDYAHMMDWSSPPGKWNDLPNGGGTGQYAPTGYIVEYGGQVGEPDIVGSISGSTVLDMLPEISIEGPISVCPNTTGISYSVQDLPGYSYVWVIEGGTLISGQFSEEIVVDWGPTNDNAKISVRAVSDIICELESTLPVKINVQLEPQLPDGLDVVCFYDIDQIYIYTAIPNPDSDYDWHITNGSIINGNGTYEIEVKWNSPGIGTLYFTESSKTFPQICNGDSPMLQIDIRSETLYDLPVVNVSCFGGSDGSAMVNVLQGASPLSYEWLTQGMGVVNLNSISGLPAGSYSVKIKTDGCVIEVPFAIGEPPPLSGTVVTTNALCFGEASGTARAQVTGGTGNYSYSWSNGAPNQVTASGFTKGNFSVTVKDENNCLLSLDFQIDEPNPLLIDSIASTLVSCPGGNDGTLEAFVSGGTAPYSFSWDYSTDLSSLATGFPQGEYSVLVTDANGCTASASQTVEETIPKVFMPTAFSPNNDGVNDTFGPATTCNFEFSMIIYNRWGTVVFYSESPSNQWDGTYGGQPAPLGQYSYLATWKIKVNELLIEEERRGKIKLIK